MFSGYPTILWDKGVLIQIHASTYMLQSFDCQECNQVRHADSFQWMFASIYPEQKVIEDAFISKVVGYMLVT